MTYSIKANNFPISALAVLMGLPCSIALAMQLQEQKHTRPDPSAWVSPPLHKAIDVGDDTRMAELIRDGADVNQLNVGSQTPLILAAFRKNAGAIELLLKHGADPKAADHLGATALHYVVMGQFEGMPQHLRAVGEQRHEVEQGCLKMSEALVAAGARVNARTKEGLTPLHFAAESALPAVVSFLLSHGADVNAQANRLGVTPLHMLIMYCVPTEESAREASKKTALLLLAKGSDLKAMNGLGETPLQMAASSCNKEFTEVILSKKGEVENQITPALDAVINSWETAQKQASIPGLNASRMETMRKECEETRQLLLDAQASK